MASPTPNKGMTYPVHGGAVNAWDSPLNQNFDQLDSNLGGRYPITISSTIAGATYGSTGATLSSTVSIATIPSSLAQNLLYDLTGTLTQALSIVYPAVGGLYLLNNNSSGAFAVSATINSTGATPVTVSQGGATYLTASSTNIITDNNKVSAPVLLSQLTQISNNKLLGNLTGSSAVPSEIGVGTGILTSSATASFSAPGFAPPASSFKSLVIKVATNTTVTVAADFVTLTDGTNYITVPVSATLDLGSNGAVNRLDAGSIATSTWYAVFVISDGTTVGTLASTSATAPTMPGAYTYKARIGWVRTASAVAQLMGTWQFGDRAQYVVGLTQTTGLPIMDSGSTRGSITTPTYFAVAVGNFVPTTAAIITSNVSLASGQIVILAPNNSYGNILSASNSPLYSQIGNVGGANFNNNSVDMVLESTNIYWATSNSGCLLRCSGWEDNI